MQELLGDLSESPLKLGAVTLSIASVGYVLVQGLRRLTRSEMYTLPPGPPRHFLLGNLLQFPKDRFYEKFCEWQRLYGLYSACPLAYRHCNEFTDNILT